MNVSLDRAATVRQAEKLLRQGKLEQAIAEYVRMVDDQPRDWNTANLLGDLYVRAGQLDAAIAQFSRIADAVANEGFLPKAAALYKKILKLRPNDDKALMKAGELAAEQGLLADARSFFTAAADTRRQRGDARGALEIAVRVGALNPGDVDARMRAARARMDLDDLTGGLKELHDLASTLIEQQRDADALVPLREIARLDPGDSATQELVGILLAQGNTADASALLTAAEPPVPTGTPTESAEPATPLLEIAMVRETEDAPVLAPPAQAAPSTPPAAGSHNPHAIDLDLIFGKPAPAVPPRAPSDGTTVEDLSIALDGIGPVVGAAPVTPSPPSPTVPTDIEAVFAQMRERAAQRSTDESAEVALTRGIAMIEAGELDASVEQLRHAMRSPQRRFAAASLLSRVFEQQQRLDDAIQWLGHAVDAPGVGRPERFDALFRIASLLETTGQPASALAICLELQSEAGNYRDLDVRIERLTRAQGGG